jgi:hypothetical protein
MDDELRMLLTKPAPSQDLVDDGRHRLQNAMRGGPPRRRRTGWLAGGLGVTAAAAAVVIVVTSGGGAPTAVPNGPPAAVQAKPMTARQVLLTAAETAETTPVATGKYWYVKTNYAKRSQGTIGHSSIETWVMRDGRSYARTTPGTRIVVNSGRNGHYADGFAVGDTELSYSRIQAMPTDPAALLTWVRRYAGHSSVTGSLIELLSSTPTPPKGRAAAFRALAGFPGVKNRGKVIGGVALTIPERGGSVDLVISPATSRAVAVVWDSGSEVVADAEWTNRLG